MRDKHSRTPYPVNVQQINATDTVVNEISWSFELCFNSTGRRDNQIEMENSSKQKKIFHDKIKKKKCFHLSDLPHGWEQDKMHR